MGGEAVPGFPIELEDNPIQHGREGGRVVVRAADADGFVTLSVSDDGPGIGKRDRRHMFGRFSAGQRQAPGPDWACTWSNGWLGPMVAAWIWSQRRARAPP